MRQILLPKLADAGRRSNRPAPYFPPLIPQKPPDTLPFVSRIPANPLKSILFKMAFAGLGSKQIGCPLPWQPLGRHPLPAYKLFISGVTKDSAGAVLASCTVKLYRTVDDQLVQTTTSDGVGVYSFEAVGARAHYVVAYKAGAIDAAGTTVNTLMGS